MFTYITVNLCLYLARSWVFQQYKLRIKSIKDRKTEVISKDGLLKQDCIPSLQFVTLQLDGYNVQKRRPRVTKYIYAQLERAASEYVHTRFVLHNNDNGTVHLTGLGLPTGGSCKRRPVGPEFPSIYFR